MITENKVISNFTNKILSNEMRYTQQAKVNFQFIKENFQDAL